MMGYSKSLLLAALMSVLLFHFRSETEAASSFDCCLQYREQAIPSRFIKGFTQQWANDACDIDAVIFYTKKGLAVCADPKKKWVKHVVHALSQRVKKM